MLEANSTVIEARKAEDMAHPGHLGERSCDSCSGRLPALHPAECSLCDRLGCSVGEGDPPEPQSRSGRRTRAESTALRQSRKTKTSTRKSVHRPSWFRCPASVVRWLRTPGMALLLMLFTLSATLTCADSATTLPAYPAGKSNHTEYPTNRVCQTMDIRNRPSELKALQGCRVIEGYLRIVLMPEDTKPEAYEPWQFPELVEITDYLLLFRANGMTNIGKMFPNLALIRGAHVMINHGLVIFENNDLESIGLNSLTDIVRGSIRIQNNNKLCFVDNINWGMILKTGEIVLQSNKEPNECPVCEKHCPIRGSNPEDRLCWNKNNCQKVCPSKCNGRTCMANGECCHEQCLGGCTGPNEWECTVCRNIVSKDTCKDSCPEKTFKFMERRCITEMECRRQPKPKDYIGEMYPYKPFNGECKIECPSGYMEVNKSDTNTKSCEPCQGPCLKECMGRVIDNLATAQDFSGCTYIKGNLEISVREGQNVARELEANLRDIRVIEGYLKIFHNSPLISLNFFKNLTEIRGATKEANPYSLIVLDNQNLQDFWDWRGRNLTISNANGKPKIMFHYNPKLCYEVIETLRKKTGLDKFEDIEVSQATNGDKVACNLTQIETEVHTITHTSALVMWVPFRHHDMRTVLGYVISYKEAPHRNVSMFEDRDACGGDGWMSTDVGITNDNPNYISNASYFGYTTNTVNQSNQSQLTEKVFLSGLKPFTQYVYYIKTYTISTERSGGISQLVYFKTHPYAPSTPRYVNIYPNSTDSLVINWFPPMDYNGELDYYKVVGDLEEYDDSLLQNRNYCEEPMSPMSHAAMIEMAAEKKKTVENEITMAKQKEEKKNEEECSCVKPNKPIGAVDEKAIFSAIAFEDALHNAIYVKRPSNKRRKREIESSDWLDGADNLSADEFEELILQELGINPRPKKRRKRYVEVIEPADESMFYSPNSYEDSFNNILNAEHHVPQKRVKRDVQKQKEIEYQHEYEWNRLHRLGYSVTSFKDEYDSQVFELSKNRHKRETSVSSEKKTKYAHIDPLSSDNDIFEENSFTHFERLVPPSNLSYVMHNLRHFGKYKIKIFACVKTMSNKEDKNKYCTGSATRSEQTLRKEKADDIPKESFKWHKISSNDSSPSIKLQWEEPNDPNGIIITYQVEYKRVDLSNHAPQIICITGLQFMENERSLILDKLPAGNYSVRVRATSIAGEGAYTEALYFDIPESNASMPFWKLMLIFLVCLFIIMAIFCMVYIFKQKYLETEAQNMRLIATVNPEYVSSNMYKPDQWEIPRKKIEIIKILGNGSFGMVYEGIARDIEKGKPEIRCAIKTVNENATAKERDDFLKEASVMKAFSAHHVVRLLGVVSIGQPALVIMELMARGDLKNYLRSLRPENLDCEEEKITLPRTIRMAIEIADGMAYLAAKKFVHRDLAARNCMVGDDLTIKVGDFGMTRDIYETDYYRKGTKGLLPVRWMAPESLRDGLFSSSSDVWSYGVVLWEMLTFASQPYQGLGNDETLRYVCEGQIMKKPEFCPDYLYDLMVQTWNFKEERRPTFIDIIKYLLDLLDNDFEVFEKVSFYHSPEGIEARNQNPQFYSNDNEMLQDLCEEEEEEEEAEEGQEDSPLRGDFGDNFSSFEPTIGMKNGSSVHYNIDSFSASPKKTFGLLDLNSSKVPLKAGYDDFDGISSGSLASSKDTLNLPLPENSVKSLKNSPFAQKKSSSKGNLSQSSIGRPSLSPQSPSIFASSKHGSRESPSVNSMDHVDPEYENRSPISLASQTPEVVSYRVNCYDPKDSDSAVVIIDKGSNTPPPRTPTLTDSNNSNAMISTTGSNLQLYSSKTSREPQRAQSPALNNGYIGGAAAT